MDLSSRELRNRPITVPSKRRFEDTTSSLFNRGFTAVTGSLKATSPKKEQLDTWLKPKIQKTEARNDSRFRKVSAVGRTRSQQGIQHCPIATPFSTTNSDFTLLYQLREQNISSLSQNSNPANRCTPQIQAHQHRFQNMSRSISSHFQEVHHLGPKPKPRGVIIKFLETQIRRLVQLSSLKERGPKFPRLLTRS